MTWANIKMYKRSPNISLNKRIHLPKRIYLQKSSSTFEFQRYFMQLKPAHVYQGSTMTVPMQLHMYCKDQAT